MTTTVTQKGQVTIPIEFRRQFGIEKGTQCMFVVRSGELVLVPIKGELSLDSMRELLAEGLSSSNEFMAGKKYEKELEL